MCLAKILSTNNCNCSYLRWRDPIHTTIIITTILPLIHSSQVPQWITKETRIPDSPPHVLSRPSLHPPTDISRLSFSCFVLSAILRPSYHLPLHPHLRSSIPHSDPVSCLTFFPSDSRSLKPFLSQLLLLWNNKQAMQQVSCHAYNERVSFHSCL